MKLYGYLKGFRRSSEMVLSSALPCAVAGIVIGVVFYSGVALRLVRVILTITGGLLIPTLILIALISIVLGMGMPTTGAYITVAVLAVPAIVALEVPTIAAHMFGLYFAVVSMVTPPIALAAFAAASVSGGDAWQTGVKAFKMGLPVYIIPFAFVFHPALLTLNSSPIGIVSWLVICAILVVSLAAVGVGYMFTEISWPERLVMGVGVVVVVFLPAYQLFGGALVLIGMVRQLRPVGQSLLQSTRS